MADPDNVRPDQGDASPDGTIPDNASPDGTIPGDIGPDGTSPGGAGPGDRPGRRDYWAVGQAARQLGGRSDLPGTTGTSGTAVRPVEESEQVAAAVDDEAPVPELAQPRFGGPEPDRTQSQDTKGIQEARYAQESQDT